MCQRTRFKVGFITTQVQAVLRHRNSGTPSTSGDGGLWKDSLLTVPRRRGHTTAGGAAWGHTRVGQEAEGVGGNVGKSLCFVVSTGRNG